MSVIECQACGRKKSDFPELNFYRFPKHRDKCKQWIELSGLTHLYKLPLEVLHMKRLCGDHFKPNQFYQDKPSILKPRAAPTKFLLYQGNAEKGEGKGSGFSTKASGPKPLLPKYSFAEAKAASTAKADGKWMNLPKMSAETFYQMLPANNAPVNDAALLERLQSHAETLRKASEPKIRRLSDLCRVCGKYSDDKMTRIFSSEGKEMALEEKILRFLPIAVKSTEVNMPLRVCCTCIGKLDSCYDMWEMCSKADVVMRSRLAEGILTEVIESDAERAAREQCVLDQQVVEVMRAWGAQQLAQSIVVPMKPGEQPEELNQQFVVVSVDPAKLPPTPSNTSKSLLKPKPMILPQPKTFLITPAARPQVAKKQTRPSLLKSSLIKPSSAKRGSSLLKKTETTSLLKNTPIIKKACTKPASRTLLHVPRGVLLCDPEPEVPKAPILSGKKSRKSNLTEEIKNFKRPSYDRKMLRATSELHLPTYRYTPVSEIQLDSEPECKKPKLNVDKSKSVLKPIKRVQKCKICDLDVDRLVQHYSETHCKFLCPICVEQQVYFDTEESLKEHYNEVHVSLTCLEEVQPSDDDEDAIKIVEVHSEADV